MTNAYIFFEKNIHKVITGTTYLKKTKQIDYFTPRIFSIAKL